MSLIMTPNTALVGTTGYEATTTNFPRLQNFWKCEEATGATTLVDSINGNNITGVSVTRTADGYGVTFNGAIQKTISGIFPTISGPFIFMCVGKFDAAGGPLIQNQTNGSAISLVDTGIAVSDDGTLVPTAVAATDFTTGATIRGRAQIVSVLNNASGQLHIEVDDSATLTASGTQTTVGVSAITFATAAGDNTVTFTDTSTTIYGMALFTGYTAVPTNYSGAIAMMAHLWMNGDKDIAPEWKQ